MATVIGPSQIVTASKYASISRANGRRAKEEGPRFLPKPGSYARFLTWLQSTTLADVPEYVPDSRTRDAWLQQVRLSETWIAGINNAVSIIDANRGWQLVGGRNTVRKWSDKLHDAANGQGWRHCIKKGSLSFWTTDMGAVFGVRRSWPFAVGKNERNIQPAPMETLENVDPARCYLYEGMAIPPELGFPVPFHMRYNDAPLFDWDYFRVASMPSDREDYGDLGYCALSRALEFVRLIYAVWRHDQEMLGARMPKGLLLLSNISEMQWEQAMEARKDALSALERDVYGGVQVLASAGPGLEADAKLVAISNLPTGWDQEQMTYLLLYGIANAYGYDAREFVPVSQGQLGTGRETEMQAEKASTKGQMDFALGFQERLQAELPDTLHFEFEERDDAGALVAAQVKKAQTEVIDMLSQMRENTGPILTREEVRTLLAEEGLIPDEWTLAEEPVTVTDEEPDAMAQDMAEQEQPSPIEPAETEPVLPVATERERLLLSPHVRRACELFWNEPIVALSTRWVNGRIEQRERILWASGDEALGRHSFPVFKSPNLTITREDVARALHESH